MLIFLLLDIFLPFFDNPQNFSGFERAVLLTEEEAVAAATKANQDLGISEIDSAPHGYNHVTSKEDADANV